jgi:sensor histidine kinase regulating citrate/malate metabolism
MPKEVQLQLFQRSFSTKGRGRGIGTYSIKLLTEKYLRGKVDFISNEGTGTTFNLYFPKNNENE